MARINQTGFIRRYPVRMEAPLRPPSWEHLSVYILTHFVLWNPRRGKGRSYQDEEINGNFPKRSELSGGFSIRCHLSKGSLKRM